jgi:tetratricopeptide (TPR) repeat protein
MNFPNEFKDIVINYNNKNFNEALKLLNNLPKKEEFEKFKIKLYASIYFLTGKWTQSLTYHNKIVEKNEASFEDYNNLAVSLFNLGRITETITYFKKCIEINNKAELPYQNLGTSYLHLGNYEQAIECFTNALFLNNRNNNCKIMMIDILNYIVPKKNQNNHLLKLNEKILNHFSGEKFYEIPKYEVIIKLIDIIKDDLSKEEHNIIYNKTEIFRRNNENLNCARHFKVFNKFSVIPEYCFSCYKVQISAKNVSSLIKLFFLFNSNYLENNNVRKCMVETRSNVKENFKGFIYCRGLEEAKKVLKISEKKLIENEIDYKNIEIKHGCTEYYEKHPNFKKINYNGRQEMLYDKSWEKYEKIIDDNSLPVQERVIKPTINNINLSDILIIRNWLDYAQIVGDNSFEKIYSSSISSNFLSQILKNQLTFRKQQF